MSDLSPTPPDPQRLNIEREMFTRLSEFQQSAVRAPAAAPTLAAVLAAAVPALEAGFAYTTVHRRGELTVTLHYQGAELGSSAPASLDSYGQTTARLLAGLLGIPVLDAEDSSEAEPQQPLTSPSEVVVTPAASPETASPGVPDELEEEEEEEFDDGLEPSEDVTRALSEAEKTTAVDMVKVLPTEQRKAFTKAFREVFQVPPDSKQIVPFITELRHLQFIDRFTVEASGGIAA